MSVYFNEAKLWRYLVTNRSGEAITLLDRLASSRTLTFTLGGPAEAHGRVPSDNPQVNILFSDGSPFVEEGERFLYAFRREAPAAADPWVIRFAGLIQQLEDSTRSEDGTSAFSAYDPWQYLFSRQCRAFDRDGKVALIPASGITYDASTNPALIIKQQIAMSLLPIGTPAPVVPLETLPMDAAYLIDGTIDYGLPGIRYQLAQSTSVGQMMQDIMATGVCDVTIDPIYDPITNPGILGAINIVNKAGQYRPNAIFAWDRPKRSLVGVSHLVDGTRRVNRMQFFGGQGGAPIPPAEDTASQATYGVFEEQQFIPSLTHPYAYFNAEQLASLEVQIRKNGALTFTVSPAAERAPMPLRDYALGDWMPLYWSANLREESSLIQRVGTIPIELDDNGLEVVKELLVFVSDVDQPPGAPGGPPGLPTGPATAYTGVSPSAGPAPAAAPAVAAASPQSPHRTANTHYALDAYLSTRRLVP